VLSSALSIYTLSVESSLVTAKYVHCPVTIFPLEKYEVHANANLSFQLQNHIENVDQLFAS